MARDQIRDMEDKIDRQRSEMKDFNRIKAELQSAKQMEEAIQQKLKVAEASTADQSDQISTLQRERDELQAKVNRMVEELDRTLLHSKSVDEQLDTISDRYQELERKTAS